MTRRRWTQEEETALRAFILEQGPEPFHKQVARDFKRKDGSSFSVETILGRVRPIRCELWPARFAQDHFAERLAEERARDAAEIRDALPVTAADAFVRVLPDLRALSQEELRRFIKGLELLLVEP